MFIRPWHHRIRVSKARINYRKIIYMTGVIIILQYIAVFQFEYSPSVSDFRKQFAQENKTENVFLYTDSSFGAMSFYYPENRHICFYYQSWFRAFKRVDFVEQNFKIDKKRIDFNRFDVYLLNLRNSV